MAVNGPTPAESGDVINVGDLAGVSAVGRDARAVMVQILGDVHFHPVTMRAGLTHQFDPLLRFYRRLFAGREKELLFIARTLVKPDGGYLVVTGPPGFGKTALMAALIQPTPEAFAFHFFNAAIVPTSVDELFFLRNVVQQMAQWHGQQNEVIPDRLDELVALYNQLMFAEMDGVRFLVLDGIDEVSAWSIQNYLPHPLPRGLHVVVTLRDVGQDWMDDYGFWPAETTHLPLDGLSVPEVKDVLWTAGGVAAEIADDEDDLAELLRVAAYPARESLGADPFYVRLLAEDLVSGSLKATDMGQRPRGLTRYWDGWWRAIKNSFGDQPVKDLFGTLAAARKPIYRADLEAINPSLVDEFDADYFDDVIAGVRRYVSTDEEGGYTLAHPRLKDHLRHRLRFIVPRYEEELLDYCAKWMENRSRYALTAYTRHLADAGQIPDLFPLIDPQWMAAKFEAFHSHRSFAEDLTLIANEAAEDGRLGFLPQLLKACLVYDELATDAPPVILEVLARIGEGQRAIDFAALISDPAIRSVAYRLIGSAMVARRESGSARSAFQFAYQAAGETPSRSESKELLRCLKADVQTADLDMPWITDPDVESTEAQSEAPADHVNGEQVDNTSSARGLTLNEIMNQLEGASNWGYPPGQIPLLQDLARALAHSGDVDQIWSIADQAPDEMIRAWIVAQVAIGLARSGDLSAAARLAGEASCVFTDEDQPLYEAPADTCDEDHWFALPAMISIAQALSLVGEDGLAGELANAVLAGARAVGFESEKAMALTAISRALRSVDQRDGAAVAARSALSVAETLLQEEDRALACYELLHLFMTLEQMDMAVRSAELLLPILGLLDEAQRIDSLSLSALALATVMPLQETAVRIRSAAEWDYDVDGEETARLLGSVAYALARQNDADLVAALMAAALGLPWRENPLLAEILLALADNGHLTHVKTIIRDLSYRPGDQDYYDEEESDFILVSLAAYLAAAGEPGLAQIATEAVSLPDNRLAALDLIREAEDAVMVERKLSVARSEPAGQRRQIAEFNERLLAEGMPDRLTIFELLESSAASLALHDQGLLLVQIVDVIHTVDRWWTWP